MRYRQHAYSPIRGQTFGASRVHDINEVRHTWSEGHLYLYNGALACIDRYRDLYDTTHPQAVKEKAYETPYKTWPPVNILVYHTE